MSRPDFPPELDALMRRVAIARHDRNKLRRERDRLDTLESDAAHELAYRERELHDYIANHIGGIEVVDDHEATATIGSTS